MTRIPSPRPDVSVNPTGPPAQRSRLLVIPDFQTMAAAVEAPPRPQHPPQTGRGAKGQDDVASPLSGPTTAAAPPPPAARETDAASAASPQATPSPPEPSQLPQKTPQLAQFVNVAAASDRVRRLAKSLPKRTTIGWQRTVLLTLGGAILAYGVTGGWRSNRPEPQASTALEAADVNSALPPEIPRMSRAPLRVERSETPTAISTPTEPLVADKAEDDIFHVPEIGGEQSTDVVDEVAPQAPAKQPTSEFPVIGAPDGSKISRSRANPTPDPREFLTGGSQGRSDTVARQPTPREEAMPWMPSTTDQVLQRETIAERNFQSMAGEARSQRDAQSSIVPQYRYPHTDPATYRDPEYVVPSIANRASPPSR